MATSVCRMVQGPLPPAVRHPGPERVLSVASPLALLAAALTLGLYVPKGLTDVLARAAAAVSLGG